MGSKYLVFRNYYFLLLNGYSIYGLCLTFWTNEFLGSYSNYKFIISFSIFNRMGFWRTLCLQSNIEEVFYLSFSIPISSFSHPDNALEACGLLTPLHIVPEWYFLCQYAMLKAVPNKNAGFIILLTSIFIFFIFGEIRNLTALCLLNNNGFSLSFFFLCSLSFLWIGAQFPQEKFLSYGRILTLDYYFLLLNLGLG